MNARRSQTLQGSTRFHLKARRRRPSADSNLVRYSEPGGRQFAGETSQHQGPSGDAAVPLQPQRARRAATGMNARQGPNLTGLKAISPNSETTTAKSGFKNWSTTQNRSEVRGRRAFQTTSLTGDRARNHSLRSSQHHRRRVPRQHALARKVNTLASSVTDVRTNPEFNRRCSCCDVRGAVPWRHSAWAW
jgi:hypothetical protein